MRKHPLLIYRRLGRRRARSFMLIALVLLAVGLYDQFTAILGANWTLLWVAFFFVLFLWSYFALLTRRASIQVHPRNLRLQGPIWGMNISYGRIYSVTSGKIEQHHPLETLQRSERRLLEPVYQETCIFVELNSYPRAFKWRKLWFPRVLFGTSRPGLVCTVGDWMALSRDLETARSNRREQLERSRGQKKQTLVGRVLAHELEF